MKELWRVKQPLDAVIHTMGWPLPRSVFGGSFAYPMGDALVAIEHIVSSTASHNEQRCIACQ